MTYSTLAAAHDALLVDLDGTLIRGSQPIPGASDELERSGLPVVYVTNNASRAPVDTASHLRDLGDKTVHALHPSASMRRHRRS